MSTWPNRGVPPAAWQGPEDKKQQPKTNSPNRLTHRNTDSPASDFFQYFNPSNACLQVVDLIDFFLPKLSAFLKKVPL